MSRPVHEARTPYAEVIGDPVAHSFSPAIHKFWLERLGIAGSYEPVRVQPGELAAYLAQRREDPLWRGCSATMPLKELIAPHLDRLDDGARQTGAVNCVARCRHELIGFNTDPDGIAAALGDAQLEGRPAVVIGAGGATRAAVAELARRGAKTTILARSPEKAAPLALLAANVSIAPMAAAPASLAGAAAIVNASPLGMTGREPMPPAILAALPSAAGAVALDLVYRPVVTPFLEHAAAAGLRTVDGLTMLVGQARRAFKLFFGETPPPEEAELRALLLSRLRAG